MPDKWEYPWYAAWDLAFHVLPFSLVDVDFGKQQLNLMLSENYLHPNGQIPAYEWNFGDVNPPVHPWATIFTYRLEKARTGQGDIEWLERSFQKLLLNFTWWLNRKDRSGKNTFEGGFLGLDNIGVFDRSSPLPTGGYLEIMKKFVDFLEARPELKTFIHDPAKTGCAGRRLGSILDETKLRRVLAKMLDENEFLSPCGIRSLSRYHAEHPYVFNAGGQDYRVPYVPGESDTGMFGGNSNWRGPIWMPVNALIIRALLQYYAYYGNEFTVECPTSSGQQMNLYQVAEEISRRLSSIFVKRKDGRRPVYGGEQKLQQDPHWRDYLQFFEYFHGDNGAGLGASHQTGWTGVIARAMHLFATTTAEQALELGKGAAFVETEPKAKSGQSQLTAQSRNR